MTAPRPVRVPTTTVELLPSPMPDDVTVLDVREAYEWEAGHIGGAVHVPLSNLPQRLDDIEADRQVLCVCAVGARSAQAVLFLQSRGFDAVNLHGGMLAWSNAGRPIEA